MELFKIGVIFCGYNTEDYLQQSLSPWIEARLNKLDGHSFVISAVSKPFKNFPSQIRDSTTKQLSISHSKGLIDQAFCGDSLINEWEARDLCLQFLIKSDCNLIWQVDSDEFYNLKFISNIINYIKRDKLIGWYKICLKNYVFDTNTYLEEPFTPPRVHRVNIGKYKIYKFSYDNDICYKNELEEVRGQEQFGNKIIPKQIAFIPHFTWMNNIKSKNKIQYHNQRGWTCSYKWDEEKGLQFNPDYYTQQGKNIPNLLKDK